ncbi:hypothetical protein EMIT0P74_30358 [Pseudomonas sp. IT-P74]|uniref:hypothetical protein n=1 Tax=Pseudomonas TaxID=286 RepID=UPI0012B71E84|nr:hypothetical protein [Pseudomonas fluorescens]
MNADIGLSDRNQSIQTVAFFAALSQPSKATSRRCARSYVCSRLSIWYLDPSDQFLIALLDSQAIVQAKTINVMVMTIKANMGYS